MEIRRSFVFNDQDYNRQKEANDPDVQPERYETESDVLSHVQTYFDISSKRLIEMVPMICDTSVALKLSSQLRKLFAAQIGIVGTQGLENSRKFLQEDAAVVERKRVLSRQKEIINRAEQILASITG